MFDSSLRIAITLVESSAEPHLFNQPFDVLLNVCRDLRYSGFHTFDVAADYTARNVGRECVVFGDAVFEKFDNAVQSCVDFLAPVVLFFGVSSHPDTTGDVIPSFDGNFDVGVYLKLDSPAFFALGDKDVCPDRDIPFLCLAGSDKKSDCSHKYSSF